MNELISVFLCGVQKGGTTTLDAYMRKHPQLAAPSHKELHFFDDETRDWSDRDYRDLHGNFDLADGVRLRYEATPIYSFWPPSIPRIHSYNPSAKLIMLFRDPFERAVSHWQMEYARQWEALDFERAIREGRTRLMNAPQLGKEYRLYSYIERGRYSEQVMRILSHFPRDQVLFLSSDVFYHDYVSCLIQIANFLGIRHFPELEARIENQRHAMFRTYVPSEDDLHYVSTQLGDDLRSFPQLTGVDVSGWPTVTGRLRRNKTEHA